MYDYLKILEFASTGAKRQNLHNCGEYEIYFQNIKQKVSNSHDISLIVHDYQLCFSNFGFSDNANFFSFITQDSEALVLYDWILCKTLGIIPLPQDLKDHIKDFVHPEQRGFINKIFTNLSFLHLNQNTNNIFISNRCDVLCITSLDRTRLFFLQIEDDHNKPSYSWNYYTLDHILNTISTVHQEFIIKLHHNDFNERDISKLTPVNAFISESMVNFNENFYLTFFDGDEWNDNISIFLSTYIANEKRGKVYLIVFELKYDKHANRMTYHTQPKEIVINRNQYFTLHKIISFVAKVGISELFGRLICFGISYESHYFEIIILYLDLGLFKKFSSFQFLQGFPNEDKKVITDIFIKSKENLVLCVVNFLFITVIDLSKCSLVIVSHLGMSSYLISLNSVFKGEYNKCLYIALAQEDNTTITACISTKQKEKVLKLSKEKYHEKSCKSLDILNHFAQKELIIDFCHQIGSTANISQYFLYLHLLSKRKKYVPLAFLNTIRIVNEQLIHALDFDINMLHYLNGHSNTGVLLKYSPYKFLTIKYELFTKFLNFSTFSEIVNTNVLIPKEHPHFSDEILSKPASLNKILECEQVFTYSNIPDNQTIYIEKLFYVSLHNNFLIRYVVYCLITLLLNRKLASIGIILNSFCKNNEEKKFILLIMKDCLSKLSNDNSHKRDFTSTFLIEPPPFESKKVQMMANIKRYFKHNNISGIFEEIRAHYEHKDYSELIKFTFYLIIVYSQARSRELKTFSKYELPLIISNIDSNVNYKIIYNSFFSKVLRRDINIIYKSEYYTEYLIFFLQIYLGITEYKNKKSCVTDIFILENIIETLNSRTVMDDTNIFVSLREKSTIDTINTHWSQYFSKVLLERILNDDCLGQCENFSHVLLLYHLKTKIKNYQKKFLTHFFKLANAKLRGVVIKLILSLKKMNYRECCYQHGKFLVSTVDQFITMAIDDTFSIKFHNQEIDVTVHSALSYLKCCVMLTNFLIDQQKGQAKQSFADFLFQMAKPSNENKKLSKFSSLSCQTQSLAVNIFILYDIFTIFDIYNNDHFTQDSALVICEAYLAISFYYSAKFPEQEAPFMENSIDFAFKYLKNSNYDQDFVQSFFLFADFCFGQDLSLARLEEIKDIVKKKASIFYTKFLGYNEKKVAFLNFSVDSHKTELEIYRFLIQYYTKFSLYVYSLESSLSDHNFMSPKFIKDFKQNRISIKKQSSDIFLQLDYIISFRKLFQNGKVIYVDMKQVEQLKIENQKKERDNNLLKVSMGIIKPYIQEDINILNSHDKDLPVQRFEDKETDEKKNHQEEEEIHASFELNLNHYEVFCEDKKKEEIPSEDGSEYLIGNMSNLSNISNNISAKENEQKKKDNSLSNNDTKSYEVERQETLIETPNFELTINTINLLKHKKEVTRYAEESSTINGRKEKQFSEDELKRKYIGVKLLINYFSRKIIDSKDSTMRILKAIFHYNTINQVEKQVTIDIQSIEKNLDHCTIQDAKQSLFPILGRSLYPHFLNHGKVGQYSSYKKKK